MVLSHFILDVTDEQRNIGSCKATHRSHLAKIIIVIIVTIVVGRIDD